MTTGRPTRVAITTFVPAPIDFFFVGCACFTPFPTEFVTGLGGICVCTFVLGFIYIQVRLRSTNSESTQGHNLPLLRFLSQSFRFL